MSKFITGFVTATCVWLGVGAALYFGFGFRPAEPEEEALALDEAPVEEAVVEAEADAPRRRRGRRRGGRSRASGGDQGGGRAGSSGEDLNAEASSGDDLREDEPRMLDLGGRVGEQQLTPHQIDVGFEGAMGRIRRCLVLAAGEDPVHGRLTFGVRVGGDGRVRAVNLTGPRAVTTGDAGECLRGAARGIQFPTFDGPEMVARYSITLE